MAEASPNLSGLAQLRYLRATLAFARTCPFKPRVGPHPRVGHAPFLSRTITCLIWDSLAFAILSLAPRDLSLAFSLYSHYSKP